MSDKERLLRGLEGISAINVTPFDKETREVDYAALEENTEFLLSRGMEVIVPCGNTGEYYALSTEERCRVVETVAKCVRGRAHVIAGVGGDAQTAIQAGRHAKAAGAQAVMIHQPVHPFLTDEGMIQYYEEIMSSVDSFSIPYVRSKKAGRNVFEYFASTSKVIAIKYAIPDPQAFAETVQWLSGWDGVWVCGLAETWAPFFQRAGSKGFTSGLVNVAPEKSLAMLAALRGDDSSAIMEMWKDIAPFEELRAKYDNGINVAVVKEAMNAAGLKGGVVRPPAHELNKQDREMLLSLLSRWGKIDGGVSH